MYCDLLCALTLVWQGEDDEGDDSDEDDEDDESSTH